MHESVNEQVVSPVAIDQRGKTLTKGEVVDILKERAQRFSLADHADQSGHNDNEDLEEMIVFSQCSTQYAVPLEMLGEIRPIVRLTEMPLASKSILGVINVRGRIVPLYILTDDEQKNHNLQGFALVGHGIAAHLAIWAQDIVGTLKVKGSSIKAPPISLTDRDYIRGVGSDGMVYLDLEKFVNNQKLYLA